MIIKLEGTIDYIRKQIARAILFISSLLPSICCSLISLISVREEVTYLITWSGELNILTEKDIFLTSHFGCVDFGNNITQVCCSDLSKFSCNNCIELGYLQGNQQKKTIFTMEAFKKKFLCSRKIKKIPVKDFFVISDHSLFF